MKINAQQYLDRINYQGGLTATIQTLQNLQLAHLSHVPFENLDIHYNTPIKLDVKKMYDKVVLNNRGGFCYELNELFLQLLINIGFEAKRISARPYGKNGEFGPEYDHLAIWVTIDNNHFLSDVGFGDFAYLPLKIENELIQHDPNGKYQVDRYENDYWIVNKLHSGEKQPQYIFQLINRELQEFAGMCHYQQTNPKSHFTQQKLITKVRTDGRITLTSNRLKTTKNGNVSEKHINDGEFESYLWKYFQIKI